MFVIWPNVECRLSLAQDTWVFLYMNTWQALQGQPDQSSCNAVLTAWVALFKTPQGASIVALPRDMVIRKHPFVTITVYNWLDD